MSVEESRPDLEPFFRPRAVAVLGSVDRGADPEQLRRRNEAMWNAPFHLVNPKGGRVGDIPIHATVADVPDEVDVAVVTVPTRAVADAVRACAAKGIRHVLVMTVGFREVGGDGVALEAELAAVARELEVRVIGPNTATNVFERMPDVPAAPGRKVALLCQSGHFGRPVVQASEFGVAFSRWVATGNEADLELADFIEHFARDPETGVIAAYIEGFRDGGRIRAALREARRHDTPVVAIKVGRTEAGRSMALSHTAHLSGSDAVVDGLFRQYGVTRVGDVDELIETASLFAKVPVGGGRRVCCYSISGGSSVMMAEHAAHHGLELPALAAHTQAQLRELVPSYLSVGNPVDTGGVVFQAQSKATRMRALELMVHDPAVEVLVVSFHAPIGWINESFVEDVCDFAPRSPVPVVTIWPSLKDDVEEFRRLVGSGLPIFRSYRGCFASLAALSARRAAPGRAQDPPAASPDAELRRVLAANRGDGVPSAIAREILVAAGLPMVEARVANSPGAAAHAAAELGLPVAMKLDSVDFPHRSDAGLVRLGVASEEEARGVYEELVARARALDPSARIEGVAVQPMAGDGTEMVVGLSTDPVLGHALTIGAGGVDAEMLADVAVRPLPIDRADAKDMIASLRCAPRLRGSRGRPPADLNALVELSLAVASLAERAGEALAELDLNPVVVRPSGAVVLDHLMVAGGAPAVASADDRASGS